MQKATGSERKKMQKRRAILARSLSASDEVIGLRVRVELVLAGTGGGLSDFPPNTLF